MRFLILIAAILLIAEYSNIPGLMNITGSDIVVGCEDTEPEEEKKTEKETKKFQSERHYYFDYTALLTFLAQQKRHLQSSGLCLKGHCPLIDQPPEA